MIMNFPHNPTTATVDLAFMKRVVAFAGENGILVVHDFAYADLCFDGYQAPSMMQVAGAREVGVEFFTLSKSYNMPGWRVGFAVGNREMIAALGRLEIVFRLWDVRAGAGRGDCGAQWAAGMRRRNRRDSIAAGATCWSMDSTAPDGQSPSRTPRCSYGRQFQSRFARWDRLSLPSSCSPRPRSRSRPELALAPTATVSCASRSSRMSIARVRRSAESATPCAWLRPGCLRASPPRAHSSTLRLARFEAPLKPVRVGLLGCGTVGEGVVKLMRRNAALLERKLGAPLELAGVADRSLKPDARAGA